jgi:hypothetical protein
MGAVACPRPSLACQHTPHRHVRPTAVVSTSAAAASVHSTASCGACAGSSGRPNTVLLLRGDAAVNTSRWHQATIHIMPEQLAPLTLHAPAARLVQPAAARAGRVNASHLSRWAVAVIVGADATRAVCTCHHHSSVARAPTARGARPTLGQQFSWSPSLQQ